MALTFALLALHSMIPASERKRKKFRENGRWGDLTLGDMFRRNAAAFPDRLAIVDPPNRKDIFAGEPARMTYTQFAAEVDRIAAMFCDAGIGKDHVVLVQLPNIWELAAIYFACAEIGAIISPVPMQYREHELSEISKIAFPKACVCATRFKGADPLSAMLSTKKATTPLFTFGPDAPAECIDLSSAAPRNTAVDRSARDISADDIFTLCWTSGTTGAPKGVPRSHNHWAAIGPVTHSAAQLADGDIILNPFPLVNMAAIGGVIMSWLQSAGTLVMHHPFDLGVFLKQIADEKPAFTLAPPAILNMLLADERLSNSLDLDSVKTIGSGSAPLAPSMVKGFQDRFGIGVVNLFGSNEGVSLASGVDDAPDPVDRASYFPARATFPCLYGEDGQHMQLRLVDVETRIPISGDAEAGELEISGPTVFEGYFNNAEQTEAAFTPDGFYKTGDLFEYAQDGKFLKFVGRSKDLIIRGGMNVAPEEIDQLLAGHPKLVEACAFAVPDDVLGERIGVAVVPRPGETVSLDDISDFLASQKVAKFKFPEKIFETDALPRNALNKVLRYDVQRRAMGGSEQERET